MFQCMECGKVFRSVKAAEHAAFHGCPRCGGVDIDITVDPQPAAPSLAEIKGYTEEPEES